MSATVASLLPISPTSVPNNHAGIGGVPPPEILLVPVDTRPAFFGYCFDIILYGLLTVQVYLYYLAFPNHKRTTKATVWFVYAVGSIQTFVALRDFLVMFCEKSPEGYIRLSKEGRPSVLNAPTMHTFGLMWLTVPTSSSIVAVTVQLFYAHRMYTISANESVTTCVIILALGQLGCGIFSAATSYGLTWFNPRNLRNAGNYYVFAQATDLLNALRVLIHTEKTTVKFLETHAANGRPGQYISPVLNLIEQYIDNTSL
ncbi:hypothetical protein NP233_g10388 [Leucocoprinus birnbaumii]|uniref:Uncharacterized protein n=1 Tax=Leucocoprinus birnbaumii TaxID=56174 RepID=A0AAD5VIW9_9AGAR|nr:hypothetical protein NP233_g10388 [Leucocoprinus birnbaumii]